MSIFGCCRTRRREVIADREPPRSYCQKVGTSVKLALYDTMAGAAAGAALTAPYGAYQAHLYYADAQKADGIFRDMQAKISAGTDTFDDRFRSNLYAEVRDVANNSIVPALAQPVIAGTVIGGCLGACLGIVRIFRAVLFPNAVKMD